VEGRSPRFAPRIAALPLGIPRFRNPRRALSLSGCHVCRPALGRYPRPKAGSVRTLSGALRGGEAAEGARLTVLAFDDEALALLCIAAGAVPADERGQWLEMLAAKLARQRKSRAEIQRAYRKRKRSGVMLLRVSVDDVAVPEVLVEAGLLERPRPTIAKPWLAPSNGCWPPS
jgi:hypothetical protein